MSNNYNSLFTGQHIDEYDARITTLENQNLDNRIILLENQNLDHRITLLENQQKKVTYIADYPVGPYTVNSFGGVEVSTNILLSSLTYDGSSNAEFICVPRHAQGLLMENYYGNNGYLRFYYINPRNFSITLSKIWVYVISETGIITRYT